MSEKGSRHKGKIWRGRHRSGSEVRVKTSVAVKPGMMALKVTAPGEMLTRDTTHRRSSM